MPEPPNAICAVCIARRRSALNTELAHSDATHEKFGIEPTTFAQFALRYAAVFRGDAAYSLTPA